MAKKEKKVESGMVKFKYTVDHGINFEGDVEVMHRSTATALVAHKIGEITGSASVVPQSEKKG